MGRRTTTSSTTAWTRVSRATRADASDRRVRSTATDESSVRRPVFQGRPACRPTRCRRQTAILVSHSGLVCGEWEHLRYRFCCLRASRLVRRSVITLVHEPRSTSAHLLQPCTGQESAAPHRTLVHINEYITELNYILIINIILFNRI